MIDINTLSIEEKNELLKQLTKEGYITQKDILNSKKCLFERVCKDNGIDVKSILAIKTSIIDVIDYCTCNYEVNKGTVKKRIGVTDEQYDKYCEVLTKILVSICPYIEDAKQAKDALEAKAIEYRKTHNYGRWGEK